MHVKENKGWNFLKFNFGGRAGLLRDLQSYICAHIHRGDLIVI